MRYIFTLVFFSLIVTHGFSEALDKKKPKKCDVYSCNDYNWNHKVGFFDPHTFQWPLHYTGEIYKDKIDGGTVDIYVAVGTYDHKQLISLKDFRHHYKDPWFLDKGIKMHDAFECQPYFDDEPHWKDGQCTKVLAGFEDKFISFDGYSCGKIIREWTAIDWCKYEPNTTANTRAERYVLVKDKVLNKAYWSYGPDHHDIEHDGWYSFQQVVKIEDHYPPDLATCSDVEFDLKGKCHDKFWYKNKIVDHGPCPGEKTTIELTLFDKWGDVVLQKWLKAVNHKEFNIDLGYLYAGEYIAHFDLKDGCGNTNYCKQYIHIKDKNPPHLICIKDLSVSIADNFGTAIWAADFVHKVEGPCYDNTVTYSFDKNDHVPSLSFKCPDGPGIKDLEVFVTGSNGVKTSCNVTLAVKDNFACNENAMMVIGKVLDWRGFPVQGATIKVFGDKELKESGESNVNGIYSVPPVELNFSKGEITSSVTDKDKRGLDASDLIALLRHVLEIEPLKKVHQRAAADINSDGEITMMDYWALTDILYDLPKFNTEYEPWKFYDETMTHSGITNHMTFFRPARMLRFRSDYNFYGVKTGDVDLSYRPEAPASSRSFKKEVSDFSAQLNQGVHQYNIEVPNKAGVFSITLDANGLQYDDILSIQAEGKDLAYAVELINDRESLIILSKEELSNKNLTLTTSRGISNLSKGSLFDSSSDEAKQIEWSLQESVQTAFENTRVFPNPFDDMITIEYDMAANDNMTISVFDASGQRVFSQIQTGTKGRNTIQLSTSKFRQGLHMLSIQSGEKVEVRRIVKID